MVLDDAEAGRPAGRIEHGLLHADKASERSFERHGSRGIANEDGRAGGVNAEIGDALAR